MNANERRANERAAKRLLEAAVRRAVVMLRGWQPCEPMPGYDVAAVWTLYDHKRVEAMFVEAVRSADLLLEAS